MKRYAVVHLAGMMYQVEDRWSRGAVIIPSASRYAIWRELFRRAILNSSVNWGYGGEPDMTSPEARNW